MNPSSCIQQLLDTEIERLIAFSLKMFGEGFNYQKGAIFGFGPSAEKETNSVLKIADVDDKTLEKIEKFVPVHNLSEERNVGMVNYEINIRGKQNLASASRKIVIKRY